MKLLIFRLEGALQSWGERAKWDMRDSALMPTKSGVLGLIACCMGLPRGDNRIVAFSNELSMAVRADRTGRIMTDFHTVQGMPQIFNAEGNRRGGGNTFTTHRQYLQDASFLIVLSGGEATLAECEAAFLDPVWPPFLGRKSCTPSVPILPEMTDRFSSVEQALREYPYSARADAASLAQVEDKYGMTLRMDAVSDSSERVFGRRYVSYLSIRT